MRLTSKNTAEFQRIYLEEYSITLSEEEAFERGTIFVELLRTIYKPITKEDYKKYKSTN